VYAVTYLVIIIEF